MSSLRKYHSAFPTESLKDLWPPYRDISGLLSPVATINNNASRLGFTTPPFSSSSPQSSNRDHNSPPGWKFLAA
jgi:hypothetical protein